MAKEMNGSQQGILAPVPSHGRHLFFDIEHADVLPAILHRLAGMVDGTNTVIGLGLPLVHTLGQRLDDLHTFPAFSGMGFSIPSTPAALWCWLRAEDPGELVHRSMRLEDALMPGFFLRQSIEVFRYGSGRDLTGFEDGTENPEGEGAIAAAITRGKGPGLDGGSFVAIQQWLHDLYRFDALPEAEQSAIIGRNKSDNEELKDAPESAHIKRTAQEDFDPEAFVLRRSMPWTDTRHAGLVFVAFGKSLDAFEALLKRMTGAEDGVTDALFSFTRPLTGAYFWCPPMRGNKLDLSAVGLN